MADLREELSRSKQRQPFKDITLEPFPDDHAEDQREPHQARRVRFADEAGEVRVRRVVQAQDGEPELASASNSSSSSSSDSTSSSAGTSRDARSREASADQETARRSSSQIEEPERETSVGEMPHDLEHHGYGPVMSRSEDRPGPYERDDRVVEQGALVRDREALESETAVDDYWEWDPNVRKLIRWHVQECYMQFSDGSRATKTGKWNFRGESAGPQRTWRGRTEFEVDEQVNEEVLSHFIVKKRGGDEIKESQIPDHEWPVWEESDSLGRVRQS